MRSNAPTFVQLFVQIQMIRWVSILLLWLSHTTNLHYQNSPSTGLHEDQIIYHTQSNAHFLNNTSHPQSGGSGGVTGYLRCWPQHQRLFTTSGSSHSQQDSSDIIRGCDILRLLWEGIPSIFYLISLQAWQIASYQVLDSQVRSFQAMQSDWSKF